MNGLAFFQVEDIPVTAEAGITRPLVTGESDKSMILVEFPREVVQMLPKF